MGEEIFGPSDIGVDKKVKGVTGMLPANIVQIALGGAAVWVGFGRAPNWARMLVGIGGALAIARSMGMINTGA